MNPLKIKWHHISMTEISQNSIDILHDAYKISMNIATKIMQAETRRYRLLAVNFISKNDDDPSVAACCSLNSGRTPGCMLHTARASGAGVPSRRVNAHARIRTHACQVSREACSLAAVNMSHPHDTDPLSRNHLSGHCGALTCRPRRDIASTLL